MSRGGGHTAAPAVRPWGGSGGFLHLRLAVKMCLAVWYLVSFFNLQKSRGSICGFVMWRFDEDIDISYRFQEDGSLALRWSFGISS